MPKINIGASRDSSTTRVSLETYQGSQLELNVGESRDFSVREVSIVEREATSIAQEIRRVRDLAASAEVESWPEPQRSDAKREAAKVADTAERILSERKWYSVSAKGVLEATKAVAEAASPLMGACIRVIELLTKVAV